MTDHTRRGLLATLGAGAAALAGCAGGLSSSDAAGETGGATDTAAETTPSGVLPPTADERLPLVREPTTLKEEFVISGGTPKDGIPSIDEPTFEEPAVDWLADDAFVFGVVRNGRAKAYPRRILAHHEIVNDTVGGDPVSVTYCPLTGTALGFERGDTTFGVSGRLVNNNLIMYDRGTETWWPQVPATGIPGFDGADAGVGRSLQQFRVIWTTWGAWKGRYPETTVLSWDTGFVRDYTDDPYGSYRPERSGYYRPNSDPMFEPVRPRPDGQYPAKTVFMGARTPAGGLAMRKDALRQNGLMSGDLGGTPHLGVYDPVLDTGHLYRNPEGRTFEWGDGEVIGLDGSAYAPTQLPLDPVSVPWFDAMWFAYFGFYPAATILD